MALDKSICWMTKCKHVIELNTQRQWDGTQYVVDWDTLQSWHWSSLRTNLVNLLGWGRRKACVAMETLTDESWAGLWNNISCFISLPLSFSVVSAVQRVTFCSIFSLPHLTPALYGTSSPLLCCVSSISFSAASVSLVYLLLWSIIHVLVRQKCPRDKPVYSSG